MNHVVVREHALLTTAKAAGDLDFASVTPSAFDYLVKLSTGFRKSGASLAQLESGTALRLDNFVGVIETPCGTVLEILPKHVEGPGTEHDSRRLLVKMLEVVLDVPAREAGEANLQLLRKPLTEWVMRQFTLSLDRLVKRGVRFDYLRVEEEQRFLRGQLDLPRQLRQEPGRQHRFQIRHDIYSPDRAENRLLKLAVGRVRAKTADPATWRLANELETLLSAVPASKEPTADFRNWRTDRLMAHYQGVLPWCELVLGNRMPTAQAGQHHGISLLFPMEKLFERYVAAWLRRALVPGARLFAPAASQYLCVHEGADMFRLEPDLLVQCAGQAWVMDTKWKRTSSEKQDKFGVAQTDMYQLFAYGHRYLAGQGDMFLIYPKLPGFSAALAPFDLKGGLRLTVVPFDLEEDRLLVDALPFLIGCPPTVQKSRAF